MSKNIKSHLLPNTEEYYEVEEIINKKLTSNGMMYLIKWKGYPSEKDFTWEPIQHLTEVEGLVKEFNLRSQQTPPPKEQKKDEPIKLSARLAQKLKKHDNPPSEVEEVEILPAKKRARVKINQKAMKKDVSKSQSSDREESQMEESKPRRIDSRKSKESIKVMASKPSGTEDIDKFWQSEGLQLGSIHKHFIIDGDLVFIVNLINKEELNFGSTYITFDTLTRLCEDKVIRYMENQLRYRLIQKRELDTDYAREFKKFWKQASENK